MNELVEQEEIDVESKSLTVLAKQSLTAQAGLNWLGGNVIVDESLDSVYEVASRSNKSVLQFVQDDPERAIAIAEMSLAKWTNVLTQAALTGGITTSDGEVALTKNQTRALELRLQQAKQEVQTITDYAMSMSISDERRRDHLIRALYINAVMRHDTRALTYLIDRVDGRPGEARVADLDYDNSYNIYMIIHTLFDRQLAVLNAGNGTVLVCCSRRAGKTHLLVAMCMIECLRRANTTCIYIGETMELTEGLIDQNANEIIEKCHLRDKRGKRLNWKKFDNGSQILVRGLSNTKDPDQIRGNKAKIIVIDEFFHLKSELLSYIYSEVLQPMQMDYADDYKFICAGTPPQVKGTYGEMAWKTWEVPHFQWTWRDNPHPVSVAAREAYVQKALEEKGLDWTTPFARREYNGEWAYDDDLLLYPNVKTYDPTEALPSWNISRIFFGLDYGVSDNDSLIGIAWSDDEGKGYEFFSVKFNRLDIVDRSMSQLEYLKQQVMKAWDIAMAFFPNLTPYEANKRILWDADDNDQHITQELQMSCVRDAELPDGRYKSISIAIGNAHKTERKMMWDKIDSLMRVGGLLLIKGGDTERECQSTILLRGQNGEIYSEIDSKAYHPDLLPAMRYALWNVLGNAD